MSRMITVVCCREWGDPAQVLRVEQWELGAPRPGQVLVQMKAAPINPSDINVIEGRYGVQPALPAVLGNEGVGQVRELGPGVSELAVGQWVRPGAGVGCWCEALLAAPAQLVPLPEGLTVEQAAVLSVNPCTAWRMLHDFATLEPGTWVAQNAATSAVGRYVIQLARHLGYHTLNVVRRPEAVEELKALGADVVVTEEVNLGRELSRLTGGARPPLALNAVGGPSAVNLAKALAPRGTLVTYGAMGKEPVAVPNGLVIFNEVRHAGYWMTAWYARASGAEVDQMFAALAALFREGVIEPNIEARYPLAEAPQAVAHARRGGRRGKVLLVP